MLCARSMLILLLCFCNIIWDEVLWCLYHGFLFSHRISLAILDHSLFVKNIFICWQLHTCIQCPLPSSHSLQTPFPTHPLPPSWILLLGLGNILSPIRATSYNVDWSCWLDPVWLNIDAVSSWIQWPWRVTASSQSSSSYTLSSPLYHDNPELCGKRTYKCPFRDKHSAITYSPHFNHYESLHWLLPTAEAPLANVNSSTNLWYK